MENLKNYDIIIHDVDFTITEKHLFEYIGKNYITIKKEDLSSLDVISEEFRNILKEYFLFLKENNIIYYFASRNFRDIVKEYVTQNFDSEITYDYIYTDRKDFFNNTDSNVYKENIELEIQYGKRKMDIFCDMLKSGQDIKRIIYIDDTPNEIYTVSNLYPEIKCILKNPNRPLSIEYLREMIE